MKRFLLLVALFLVSASTVLAQPFLPSVSPRSQSADSGVVTFQVIVTVDVGYTASIFLGARIPTLPGAKVTVSPKYLNSPYTDTVVVTIALSGAKHGGDHDVIIEARNGSSVAADTVTLTIPNRTGWSVYDSFNSPLLYGMQFSLDKHRGIGWFGTDKDLLSFDGTNWESYEWPDSLSYRYAHLYGMTTDTSGTLWAIFSTEFTAYPWTILRRGTDSVWTVIDAPDTATGMTDEILQSFKGHSLPRGGTMAGDDSGNVWIVTGRGLLRFDGSQWHYLTSDNSGYLDGWDQSIAIAPDGNVWILDAINGMVRYDGQYWSVYGFLELSVWNQFLAFDPDGSLWVQGGEGSDRAKKVQLDGTVLKRLSYDSSEFWRPSFVSCVGFSDSGTVWVGVANQQVAEDGGLLRFDSSSSWLYTIGNSGLPDVSVSSINRDDFGTMWVLASTFSQSSIHYSLSLIDGNSPPTSLFTVTPTAVPIRSDAGERSLSLYPNPVSGWLTIRLGASQSSSARLTVVDGMGAEVAAVFDGPVESGDRVLEFDASTLPSGSYFLRLVENGRTIVRPLVIAR